MIKHIVLWSLHDHAEGNDKITNAKIAKEKLEALPAIIDEIIEFEVGFLLAGEGSNVDLSLYSSFNSVEDLKRYQAHPAHQAVIPFIGAITADRSVIDYQTES